MASSGPLRTLCARASTPVPALPLISGRSWKSSYLPLIVSSHPIFPENLRMSALFAPLQLRGLKLSNRIMVSPMCQYSAVDGAATDWHFTHINNLSLSGAAMFCIEATHVEAIGRITAGCLGLYDEATEAALKPILASVRKHSKAAVAMQLAHAGRKGSSYRPWEGGQQVPLGKEGSGWDVTQTIGFAKELKKRGVDWIDVSSGGVSPQQKIPLGPGYQVPLSQAVKEATGVTTIAVGLITEAKQGEDVVALGKADMIALARGMLYDPRWGWHAAAELHGEVSAPPQYWRSQPSNQKALFGAVSFGAR